MQKFNRDFLEMEQTVLNSPDTPNTEIMPQRSSGVSTELVLLSLILIGPVLLLQYFRAFDFKIK